MTGPNVRRLDEEARRLLDNMDAGDVAIAAEGFRDIAVAMEKAAVAVERHDYEGVPRAVMSVIELMETIVFTNRIAKQVVDEARDEDAQAN
jgi:hypothetical protein